MSGRGRDLPGRVAALSAHGRALLADRLELREARSGGPLVAYVAAAEDTDPAELRRFLAQRLPDAMVPASFVVLSGLPRTPSGKVDVRALPAPAAALRPAGPALPPHNDVEATLAAIWSDLLGGVMVARDDNFFEIGGDSILSIQVVARAARAGLRLAPDDLFRHQTVAELAHVAVPMSSTSAAVRETLHGPVPLTPIQHWFTEQRLARPGHWHHVVWLDAPAHLDAHAFREALGRIIAHHDALRLRFRIGAGEAEQWHEAGGEGASVRRVDVSSLSGAELEGALRTAADDVAASMDLAGGCLIAALLAERNATPFRIGLVAHHLVVDPVSWSILLEDLSAAYDAIGTGSAVMLPPPTASFRTWAGALNEHADDADCRAQVDYWARTLDSPADVPRDLAGKFTEATAHAHTVALDAERTRRLIEDVPGVYGTQVDEVLLTALMRTLGKWTGRPSLRLGIERHGREAIRPDLDLSRTVGWFTSYFPVALTLDGVAGPGEALMSVKEQMRIVPERGVGYGVLRYLSPQASLRDRLRAPEPDVIFNYGGRFDTHARSALRFALRNVPAASRAPVNHRAHRLEVGAAVPGERLQMHWAYSRAVHHAATIERLAADCLREVEALIDHCVAPGAGGFTPSDFPEAGLSQAELDRFLEGLGR